MAPSRADEDQGGAASNEDGISLRSERKLARHPPSIPSPSVRVAQDDLAIFVDAAGVAWISRRLFGRRKKFVEAEEGSQ